MNRRLRLFIRLWEVGDKLLRGQENSLFPKSKYQIAAAFHERIITIHHRTTKELPQKIALGIRCISLVNQQEVHEAIVSDDGNAHRNERVDDSGEPSEASQQGGFQSRLLAFIARQTKPLWGRNDPCDNLQTKEGPQSSIQQSLQVESINSPHYRLPLEMSTNS